MNAQQEVLQLAGLEDILKDRIVCQRYIQAIRQCPFLFEGKTVMALYSGIGFLTLLCCQAGAKHVFDIDQQDFNNEEIAYKAVKDNGYEKQVTFLRGDIQNIKLPVDHVDIIVSMWQGHCLFYENRLENVVFMRDKYLKKEGGLMFPDAFTFKLALIEDEYYYDRKINFWDEVYGIKMSCIKDWVLTEPIIDLVDPSVVVTDTFKLLDRSIDSIKLHELDFSCKYELSAMETISAHALIAWFELHFTLGPRENVLNTSPFMPKTRYRQAIFYLKQRLNLKEGDIIEGSIAMKRIPHDRSSNFKISIRHGSTNLIQFYTLN